MDYDNSVPVSLISRLIFPLNNLQTPSPPPNLRVDTVKGHEFSLQWICLSPWVFTKEFYYGQFLSLLVTFKPHVRSKFVSKLPKKEKKSYSNLKTRMLISIVSHRMSLYFAGGWSKQNFFGVGICIKPNLVSSHFGGGVGGGGLMVTSKQASIQPTILTHRHHSHQKNRSARPLAEAARQRRSWVLQEQNLFWSDPSYQ